MGKSVSNAALTDEIIATLPGAAVILKHHKLRNFLQRGMREGKVEADVLLELLDSLNIPEDDETEVFGAVDALGVVVLDEKDSPGKEPENSDSKDNQRPQESIPIDDSLAIFLREVGSYEIPTRQDIVMLCQRMEAGNMAQAAIDSAQSEGKEFDAAQIKELQRAVRRGQDAKERLVNGNMRLVVSIAKKLVANTSSMDLMDLIQEGAIGLMKAAEKFDYRRNVQFSTYATWWIRHDIERAVAEQDRYIRIPVYMTDVITKLNAIKREAGEELTEYELAIALSGGDDAWNALTEKGRKRYINKVKTATRMERTSTPLSMDYPKNDTPDAAAFGDYIADTSESAHPELVAERYFLLVEIERILSTLPAKEARVIRLRFGLEDGKPRLLDEIGREFRVTKERIRQIEASALAKLRTPRLSRPISAYIEDVLGHWEAGYDELEDADWDNIDS